MARADQPLPLQDQAPPTPLTYTTSPSRLSYIMAPRPISTGADVAERAVHPRPSHVHVSFTGSAQPPVKPITSRAQPWSQSTSTPRARSYAMSALLLEGPAPPMGTLVYVEPSQVHRLAPAGPPPP